MGRYDKVTRHHGLTIVRRRTWWQALTERAGAAWWSFTH